METKNCEFDSKDKLNMLSSDNPPDQIIYKMLEYLPKNALLFEYGVGLGRNAIPLAKNGYEIHVQDLNEKLLDILKANWNDLKASPNNSYGKLFIENSSDAVNHELKYEYDGFLCIRVLHFLSPENARKVINKMQNNTKIGGLNAINYFTSDTLHGPDFFFPSIQEIKNIYTDWEIIFEPPLKITEASERTNGRQMFEQSILFRKIK